MNIINKQLPLIGVYKKPCFESYSERLAALKQEFQQSTPLLTRTLISGAGPAGLIRALGAGLLQAPVVIIEKRSETSPSRENTLRLNNKAVELLQYYGVIQLLIKEKYIDVAMASTVGFDVRICDLEWGIKQVIKDLNLPIQIEYDCKIESINDGEDNKPSQVLVRNAEGHIQEYYPDFLVIAEGAQSTTLKKLEVERETVLPKLMIITSLFQKGSLSKNKIKRFFTNILSFLEYCVRLINFITLAIFKSYLKKPIANHSDPQSKIAGASLLVTPNQNYVGIALNQEESEKLRKIRTQLAKINQVIKENANLKTLYSHKIKKLKKSLEKQLRHWSYHGFFAAKFFLHFDPSIKRKALNSLRIQWYPLSSVHAVEIGADYCNKAIIKKNKTWIIPTGDALNTVDPLTSLGCSTAITTSNHFLRALTQKDQILEEIWEEQYEEAMNAQVQFNMQASIQARQDYRPDAM